MKKSCIILTGLLLIASVIANGQSINKDQADFLKWYVPNRGLATLSDTTIKILNEETINSVDILLIAGKFKMPDREHIKAQIQSLNITSLDTSLLKQVSFRDSESKCFISFPVFTIDKKIAFIRYKLVCGPQCEVEGIDVYERIPKESWKPYHVPLHFPLYITTNEKKLLLSEILKISYRETWKRSAIYTIRKQ